MQEPPGVLAGISGEDQFMTGRLDRLRAKVEQSLAPERLEIDDESARHAGHAGVREAGAAKGGETHYAMLVVSSRFGGLSRVQRSRLVHDLLAAEFSSGLHALSLTLRTPEEARSSQGTAG
jgi:BolA protein